MILCVLFATWKKTLFSIYFSDAALQELLGDHHYGPLIPKPGVPFPCPAGFKASSILMLLLAFQKMMFISFRYFLCSL
jgi:hypothetical protein